MNEAPAMEAPILEKATTLPMTPNTNVVDCTNSPVSFKLTSNAKNPRYYEGCAHALAPVIRQISPAVKFNKLKLRDQKLLERI